MNYHISYKLLAEAVDFYKDKYQYHEVPWVARSVYLEATRPPNGAINSITVTNPLLKNAPPEVGGWVASGEQSFLQFMVGGIIPKHTQVMAITPCYRPGDGCGLYNFPTFMKLELFSWGEESNFRKLQYDAQCFFGRYLDPRLQFQEFEDGSADILYVAPTGEKIELGSYGSRTMEFNGRTYTWAYGTGLAEPRLSQCLDLEVP